MYSFKKYIQSFVVTLLLLGGTGINSFANENISNSQIDTIVQNVLLKSTADFEALVQIKFVGLEGTEVKETILNSKAPEKRIKIYVREGTNYKVVCFLNKDKRQLDICNDLSGNSTINIRGSIMDKMRKMFCTENDSKMPVSATDTTVYFTFFEHTHGEGKVFTKILYPGENFTTISYEELSAAGFNDVISSIRIEGKGKVVLFEHSDFEGKRKLILNSSEGLDLYRGKKKFNDMTSSIKLRRVKD